MATDADIRERNAEFYTIYDYYQLNSPEELTDEDKKKLKKVVSVPQSVKVRQDEMPPAEFIYTVRPNFTAESLYKTDDMNAFIWYVANRGDNFDETLIGNADEYVNVMYEFNKMAWDSRRLNARVQADDRNQIQNGWQQWLTSRTSWDMKVQPETSDFKMFNENGEKVETLYPILQFEPSEAYGSLEHLIVTFPAQRYLHTKKSTGAELEITSTIYKFNADYLKSIKIFNWKTIIMNLLYELNGISPIPDVQFNLSLSERKQKKFFVE